MNNSKQIGYEESMDISPLSLHSNSPAKIQDPFVELRAPYCMERSHWHNHIEVNILFRGNIEYLVNCDKVWLSEGEIVVFWAAIPHRVTAVEGDNPLIGIINIPVHQFLSWPLDEDFSAHIMNGSLITSPQIRLVSKHECARWKNSHLINNIGLQQITVEEIALLMRRICITNWEHSIGIKCGTFQDSGVTHTLQFNVQKMLSYIANHHHQPIQVSDVADSVGLHTNYTMKLFQRVMKMSIKKYINTMRLNHACALLSDTTKSIYDVGVTCGFRSAGRFFEQFKKNYNMTPKQYRSHTRRGR
ncbi:transcriptional regulator MelR [Vibrio nomapromontoriensis]|uniref:transcriptional regulator MelR n=1 Tax=Vibrio nomapromontoriensis TaxID=2910246 RepID=UPI003D145590